MPLCNAGLVDLEVVGFWFVMFVGVSGELFMAFTDVPGVVAVDDSVESFFIPEINVVLGFSQILEIKSNY